MIAQFIFDKLIGNNQPNSIFTKFLKLFRQRILSGGDPIVKYSYKGKILDIHLSHDFPFIMKEYPQYSQNLGWVVKKLYHKYNDLKVIDVGANIGDSAILIKDIADIQILCIEGNPKFLGLLKSNTKNLNEVSIADCFVGEESSKVEAISGLGSAHLKETSEGAIEVKTMHRVLEENLVFKNAKLLKIDTDGFDNKIIRASKSFLEESKASVFFEYDPYFLGMQNEKGYDIYDFFVSLGYTKFLIFDNIGDFLISLDNNSKEQFMELHAYFNKGGKKYMDIFVIHQTDRDIV
ncbi:MAG: FkbM family methyltransferase [Bacteroidia bacterium]|nr:FkbM family methyltransferase [Bacteroidia bacterium]